MVNSWEEEEADSDEDLAELEAQLYSQIYYEATDQSISSSKSLEFNVSDYIANDVGQPSNSQDGHLDTSSAMKGIDREKVDNIDNNQSDDQDEDEESRYSSLKVLESNPFYSEPESSEDEGIIDSSNVREQSETTAASFDDKEKKEASSSDSEGSEDDDDEGIIVLPAPPRHSPDVINIEESESEVLEEVYELKSRKKIQKMQKSKKGKILPRKSNRS